ncbi:MAG TPA: potassium transporter [Candidatus Paenalcaligenes intestinipullorum]|uniref:Potassium transporter n=1 Tax=Candidatus Paenalcaligenes intestinipullorum TaxID=2838718 RepID=A0A9D2U7F8_9BURK|nr:potassium transporter [Candidatus Paenalcaligenes intestinipullorum]
MKPHYSRAATSRTRAPFGRLRMDRRTMLNASPPAVLAFGFFCLIILGTLLLMLPAATTRPISWFESFFMATSAVTVTGLSIVELASTFTLFGQIILTILVQLGGLGIVTFAVLVAMSMGRRFSVKEQALALEAFNQTNVGRIRQTAVSVVKIAFTLQLGAIVLLGLWWSREASWLEAFYQAYFHVTMAFNNAGMSLYDHSLSSMVSDTLSIWTLSLMIMLGGLGFPVIIDVLRVRRWSRLSTYSKLIIITTLLLNLFGFLFLWGVESRNPFTIGNLPLLEQINAAWFQAIATRTAGFSSMDPSLMKNSSVMLMMVYMIIGGGSLSTASGIKLGTFIVLFAAVHSFLRQREEIVISERTLSPTTVQKATALISIMMLWFMAGMVLITFFDDDFSLRVIMFEVVSAVTTTGMGHGITPQLSTPTHCILLVLMFVGRLGPLTLIYILAHRRRSSVRYPEMHFQVG